MITDTTHLKVLLPGRMPMIGKKEPWPDVGEWHSVTGVLQPCNNGLHLTRADQAWLWLIGVPYTELYLAEAAESDEQVFSLYDTGTVCVRKARLLKKLHYSLDDFIDWSEHTVGPAWSWTKHLLRYLNAKNRGV